MIAGFAAQERPRDVLGIDGSATVEQTWIRSPGSLAADRGRDRLGRDLGDDEIVLDDVAAQGTYGIPDGKTIERSTSVPASRSSHRPGLRGSRWRR